eukprot:gnl/Trimastix_PCT/4765.p1 GENE.gnl/Trimastix_PCT/4765~~gnl/Trimastix_PCT/4765.p1  ORF type:complete len:148 (-),score=60.51 gnl/Trimastix_PCT/4765:28-471(-)
MVDFPDFPAVLIRTFNFCIKNPDTHFALFFISEDSSQGRVDFIQNMEYKFVELLSIEIHQSSEAETRNQIHYRYHNIKTRLQMMTGRLQDVNSLVKIKHPALLHQLSKAAPRTPSSLQRTRVRPAAPPSGTGALTMTSSFSLSHHPR